MSLPTQEDMEEPDFIDTDLTLTFETPLGPLNEHPASRQLFDDCLRVVKEFHEQLDKMDDFTEIKNKDFCHFVLALDYLFFRNGIFNYSSIFYTILPLFWKFYHDESSSVRGEARLGYPPEFRGATYFLWLNLALLKTPLALISTLLHEMAHLHMFALDRMERDAGRGVRKHLKGVTGHGYYWQRLARHIEARAHKIIDKGINLNCFDALSREREESGIEPSKAYYEAIYGDCKGKCGKPMAELAQEFVEAQHIVHLNKNALQEMAFPDGGDLAEAASGAKDDARSG